MDPLVELPLFPLHTVLCPGVALPLHIFEDRYRLMIGRCIERREPFGVVLIRDGREVRSTESRVADVRTTARIRQGGRDPDGRVGRRFMRYLELLQPALAADDGPEIEIEVEVESAEDAVDPGAAGATGARADARVPVADLEPVDDGEGIDTSSLTDDQRRELLLAAARRLMSPGDPTAISYLLTGLVQVELPVRQQLLETPDTATRLARLDALLAREVRLLSRHLKPLRLDPRLSPLRRN